jgi:hypothetical protein
MAQTMLSEKTESISDIKISKRQVSRNRTRSVRLVPVDRVPDIKYTTCNYRLHLNIFLEGKDLIGVVRHPFGNNMAAASSIRRLTTRDPDFYGKVKSCTRGGKVFVLKIM